MMSVKRPFFLLMLLTLTMSLILMGCGDAGSEGDEVFEEVVEPLDSEETVELPTQAPPIPPPDESEVEEDVAPEAAEEEASETDVSETDVSETDAPAIRGASDDIYEHPSGAFELTPFSDEYEEYDNVTAFYSDEATVFALYFEADDPLDEDSLFDFGELALQELDLDDSFGSDFEMYDEVEFVNDGYYGYFYYEFDDEEAEGDIYLVSGEDDLIYALVLLTDDYEESEDAWYDAIDSLMVAGGETAVASDTDEEESDDDEAAEDEADEEDTVAEPPVADGEYSADSGFRPAVDGFGFENYGDEVDVVNLTPIEMKRMFGDDVCASTANGGCILTPPARRWMEQANGYMAGGHCEGMAVLSSLMYYGVSDESDFGSSRTSNLSFQNELLQREIAYWFVTQSTYPGGDGKVYESPTKVVNTLISAFEQGLDAEEWWVVGIYQSDFTGGHAITPFAVEDQGNGIYHIMVYDNNWPGDSRFITVDTNEDTWQYQASTNPNEPDELYEGDADTQTLEVVSISPRLTQQDCNFCAGAGAAQVRGAGLAAVQETAVFNEVWLDGATDLLIVTTDGQRLGFVDGEFVNEIPGSTGHNFRFLQGVEVWDAESEPVYQIPLGVEFSITVDAGRVTEPTTSTVTMIGPGYNLIVEDIYLDPGTQDVITVSPDGSELSYQTEYNDAPDMIFGIETPAADYEFIVAALDIEAGAEFFVKLDIEAGDLSINTRNMTEFGTYEIVMYRVDDEGEQWFSNNDVYLEPGDTAYLNFLEWEGPGSSMFIDIDYLTDETIDESIELFDEFEEE